MARQRDLIVNFERMRREMDDLFGDVWGERSRLTSRRGSGFTPRVDVYYCDSGNGGPRAVVRAELAGVDPAVISLEIHGRRLILTGQRPLADESGGRVYQQVEIPTGTFRRTIELSADVEAESARATYEDGVLRVELPLRRREHASRRVPIERSAE